MEERYKEIKRVLEEYYGAIASLKTSEPVELKPVVEKLDALGAEMIGRGDKHFSHYLENKSYRKAYDWLSARGF